MGQLENDIKKFVLANAFSHGGKAQTGAIIGKLISAGTISKANITKTKPTIDKIIKDIGKLSLTKQEAELKKIYPQFFNKEKEKPHLKELPNAVIGKVVTRMPPGVSKYPHIGHSISFLINYMYAKKYKGKCYLKVDDTNPDKDAKEYVSALKKDFLDYLDVKPTSTLYASDTIPALYKLASQLIKRKKAYVCECPREKVSKLRRTGEPCNCRSNSVKVNLEKWKKMLSGDYAAGKITLRLKIDLESKNSAMRDPAIFRINKAPHYKQKKKYAVWPLYDFASIYGDVKLGVTHVLRSSEFGSFRIELQSYICDLFKWKKPTFIHYGRTSIRGGIVQGREILKLVKEGKVSGWDDPQLLTLRALRRRGIVKETYYELVKVIGLSMAPSNIEWVEVAAINRKFVDPLANRYFFISSPVKLKVAGVPKEAKLKTHPDKPKTRPIKVSTTIYIDKSDFTKYRNKQIRLKGLGNLTLKKTAELAPSAEAQTIHWVSEPNTKIQILMPNNKWVKGRGEPLIGKVKPKDIVQFERFGFVKCEAKNRFIFTHK